MLRAENSSLTMNFVGVSRYTRMSLVINGFTRLSNNVCKQAIKDAIIAYQKFFKGLTKRPKYKSRKHSKQSFYADPAKIRFTDTHVKLESIAQSKKKNRQCANWFRLAEHERIPIGVNYANPRISFDGLNWFLTIGIETETPEPARSTNDGIGIDLGIKDFAICSTGHVYRNINKTSRVRRLKKKQRRLQRKLSRKYEKNKKGGWLYIPAIILAAMKLALYHFPALTDADTLEENAIRSLITSETTDGHNYALSNEAVSSLNSEAITGDSEIDRILKSYMRSRFSMAVV